MRRQVTILAKSSGLQLAGVVLNFVGAIVAILLGVLALISFSINSLIAAVLYLALGLLSLIFTFRIYKRYHSTWAILLLVFSIIFIVIGAGTSFLGIEAAIVGVLMLIGIILIFVAKA
jgi:hypothetical protein